MAKKTTTILLCLLSVFSQAQNWNVNEFGLGGKKESFDLVIGEGKNDDIERIYVTTKNGDVTEYTYNKSAKNWNKNTIISNLKGLVMIELGDARNDNKNRLYITEFSDNGRLIELEWDGANWINNEIDNDLHSLGVVLGDGRNDGKNYLYIGSTNKGTWEYAWDGTKWLKTQMHFQASEGVGIIGSSKNDKVNRLIFTSDKVKEYTWNGSKYTTDSPSPKIEWPDAIHLGKGRNDGINRIYANVFAKRGRIEYTWNGSKWTEKVVNPQYGRGDIYTTSIHKDAQTRIYTTTTGYKRKPGSFLEYLWNSSTNTFDSSLILDGTSGATAMIYSGYGRNDDTMRLYATNYKNGSIYEITSKTPFVNIPVNIHTPSISTISINVFPNPSNGVFFFEINNPKSLNFHLDLVDYTGKVVQIIDEIEQINKKQKIDLSNQPNGIYYLRIYTNGQYIVKQFSIIND